MNIAFPRTFDPAAFLANAGLGRRIIELEPKEPFFCQGDPADSVFYIQKGRAKVTVVSKAGKEATITLLEPSDFVGEEALAAVPGLRLSSATAITACTALKITCEEMVRVMHGEHEFSDLFMKFLLARSMRVQADLVDQLFNSSEKRLARILLLMAAGSTGRCNTGFQFTRRGFKAQGLSRALIEAQSYLVEIGLRVAGQVRFLREVLS